MIKNLLTQNKIDALLVSNYHNIYYLSGFQTSDPSGRDAWMIITNNDAYLITDGRYIQNSKSKYQRSKTSLKIKTKIITRNKNFISHLRDIIQEKNVINLGFEEEDIKFGEYQNLVKNLPEVMLIPVNNQLLKIRSYKTNDEIESIKKACLLCDQCLHDIIPSIKIGITEKEIAWRISEWVGIRGHDLAFTPIVAIDKHSAIPHYVEDDVPYEVNNGSLILIDFGIKYKKYCSDMTRTLFYGKPSGEQASVYNSLLTIQEKIINEIAKTKTLSLLDARCRKQMDKNNLPQMPHSLGHGVGLEIHEYPKVTGKSQVSVAPGQVFTVEPGVYYPNKWGIRIEDTVLIDDKGGAQVLTGFTKNLLII